MEKAQSLVMAPAMPRLGPGELRLLNPCKIVTTPWSVHSTKCLATNVCSFYHPMKPNMPYRNFGQREPYYTGHPFSTEQVSSRFSPHLPWVDPDQDGASEWRFHTQACSVNRAGEDETRLTYGDDAYGGSSISGHGPNHAMTRFWGTPAPQPLQNSDYSMVSVFHQMSSDSHLILPFHEAKYSILQQP
jgi:hypothetical protein